MWSDWWSIPLSIVGGVVLLWLTLMVTLWIGIPDEPGIRDSARLLPDLVRLIKRLATDPGMPRGVRVRLAVLLGYLALPIDLIPDFIPVVGYADDAIVIAIVLRSVTRAAGPAVLDRHWPGTPEGLAAVRRLCRLPDGIGPPPK